MAKNSVIEMASEEARTMAEDAIQIRPFKYADLEGDVGEICL